MVAIAEHPNTNFSQDGNVVSFGSTTSRAKQSMSVGDPRKVR